MGDVAIDLVNPSERIRISFNNLCFSVSKPEKVDILKNLHGSFNPGRLCALVGPSGAGKTSLLNILSGFQKPSSGSKLLINDEKVSKSTIRRVSSYIAQDVTFLNNLTVHETLKYAADFKLPSSTSKSTKLSIIANIIKLLGMEKCEHNYTQKLSGGERKRLAIGEELITNPPVMIFDEPTSGLDSVSTVQVIKHLMDLAHSGRTIICVIHQPSSYVLELFDDIYLLSDGQCIYNGAVVDIVPAFREAGFHCPQYYNRADFILEVASKQREGNLELLMENAKESVQNDQILMNANNYASNGTLNIVEATPVGSKDDLQLIDSNSYQLSQFKQFFILLGRSFLCTRRQTIIIQLKFVTHLLCGVLFGYTYYDIGDDANKIISNVALIFILLMFIYFSHSIPVILFYPDESKIFHREYLGNRYGFLPYFISKVLSELPFLFIYTFCTLIPAYFISNQPAEYFRFALVSLLFILLTLHSLYYGYAVGIVFGARMGVFFLPIFSVPQLIYAGFFVHYKDLALVLKPLHYFSFNRYYFEGFVQALYGFDRAHLNCDKFFCMYRMPRKIFEFLQIERSENVFFWDIFGAIVWILILKTIAITALKIQSKKMLR